MLRKNYIRPSSHGRCVGFQLVPQEKWPAVVCRVAESGTKRFPHLNARHPSETRRSWGDEKN